MKKLIKIIIIFILLFTTKQVFADSGHSTIVMDVDSGRILYSKDINTKRLIASTTKIMTCIIVLENSDLEETIKVGEEVLSMYGTNIYIEVGEELTIKDLLYGLMLRSANDAALTLAIHTFGTEEAFVKAMNDKAKEIGMKNTIFENPHGLDEDTKNYSTAYDMALLSKYAYQNNIYREIISTKKYTTKSSLKSYIWYNRMNLLAQYKNCIGGKNGYTPAAGKSLVSLAKKDDVTLTIVSLDDSDIYINHKNLYEKYFKLYKKYTIIDKDTFQMNTYFMKDKTIYLKKSFQYTMLEDELEDVSTLLELFNETKDKEIGRIIIKLKDKEIGKIKIYEKENKKKENKTIFQKIKNLIIR